MLLNSLNLHLLIDYDVFDLSTPWRSQIYAEQATSAHICTGTEPTAATSALGLSPPLPHLHRDWAHGL